MRILKVLMSAIFAAMMLVACGNDEPQWADPEAHEKTEQLRKQFVDYLLGTWHKEYIGDKHRFFDQITFNDDGTITGVRRWQSRSKVKIDKKEVYTDWLDVEMENDTYEGTWDLRWRRENNSYGQNTLYLFAVFDNSNLMAWSHYVVFGYADNNVLCIQGGMFDDFDGWSRYQRGAAEPSF